MQTRRDQLQAYRFQNRRALAALITGEPNVVDPPMRRLTITTLSGIMIAVLITVAFTVFGLIRPKAGDSWKDAGSIVVDENSGTSFVYLNDKLYPIVNYTSGVLAMGGTQRAQTVTVTDDDIQGVPRGPQIGIPGLPNSLPDSGSLVSSPIAACSRQQVVDNDQVGIRVSVQLGGELATRPVAAGDGVLVDTGAGSQSYLLYDGQRLAVAPGRVATALGYSAATPLQVGRAFIDAVPQGPTLAAPTIPGAGGPANLAGISVRVGQLITTAGGRSYVALADGKASVTDTQKALLQTLAIGPGGTLLDPVSASESAVLQLPDSAQWTSISRSLTGLPADVPTLDPTPADNGGVCAQFSGGNDEPRFTTPASRLPSFQPSSVRETTTSQRGGADSVVLPPGRAALLAATGASPTVFLVGDSGRKFAASSNELLAGFGYGAGDATKVPAALLKLIPSGPALSKTEALRPVAN